MVDQDSDEAKRWYRRAAEQGHVLAQSNLGFQIYAGRKSAEELVEAYAWVSLAAGKGNVIATSHRNAMAELMTPGQLEAGRRMAAEIQARSGNR